MIDSCKLGPQDLDQFFWVGDSRGSTTSATLPVDNHQTFEYRNYPDVSLDSAFSQEDYDTDKDYFIFLHGFNVRDEAARVSFRILYRRLYWTGFRGNFIGINWDGIHWLDFLSSGFTVVNYRTCMLQAMASARPVKEFIRDLPGGAEKKNIMGHSMGNVVMWEAIRQHAYDMAVNGDGKLANRVYSVQAALWEEAFDEYGSVSYTEASKLRIYLTDELIKKSWVFWFNQPEYIAKNAIMKSYNSYLSDDSALDSKKTNAYLILGGGPLDKAFHRDDSDHPGLRNQENLPDKPPMLRRFHHAARYTKDALRDPLGFVSESYFDVNINAFDFGWREAEHSDFKNNTFYGLYDWYEEIFKKSSNLIKEK